MKTLTRDQALHSTNKTAPMDRNDIGALIALIGAVTWVIGMSIMLADRFFK